MYYTRKYTAKPWSKLASCSKQIEAKRELNSFEKSRTCGVWPHKFNTSYTQIKVTVGNTVSSFILNLGRDWYKYNQDLHDVYYISSAVYIRSAIRGLLNLIHHEATVNTYYWTRGRSYACWRYVTYIHEARGDVLQVEHLTCHSLSFFNSSTLILHFVIYRSPFYIG